MKLKKERIFLHKIFFNDKINLGIEILRTYMSFSIVVLHFLKIKFNTNFFTRFMIRGLPFYVPTFFLISFYFSYNLFTSKNIVKIKDRFIRILIPYTIWPIVLWFRDIIHKKKSFRLKYFKHIFLQLLIGFDFYPVFWFHFDLIVISIIFVIIIFSFYSYYLIILKITFLLFVIFNKEYEARLDGYKRNGSLKPLFRSFAFCATGFFLSFNKVLQKFSTKKYIIFLLIFPSIYLINKYKIIKKYSKRLKVIVVEFVIVSLFLIFSLIPLKAIKSNMIKKIIKQLTSYTGGIYYIHYGVRTIFSTYFKIFSIGDFKSCIINYLSCYFICHIGLSLFKKTKLKYLFI